MRAEGWGPRGGCRPYEPSHQTDAGSGKEEEEEGEASVCGYANRLAARVRAINEGADTNEYADEDDDYNQDSDECGRWTRDILSRVVANVVAMMTVVGHTHRCNVTLLHTLTYNTGACPCTFRRGRPRSKGVQRMVHILCHVRRGCAGRRARLFCGFALQSASGFGVVV